MTEHQKALKRARAKRWYHGPAGQAWVRQWRTSEKGIATLQRAKEHAKERYNSDTVFRARRLELHRIYRTSEKARLRIKRYKESGRAAACSKRYRQSEKGQARKAKWREYWIRYRKTEKNLARQRRYRNSATYATKVKGSQRQAYNRRYYESDQYKILQARRKFVHRGGKNDAGFLTVKEWRNIKAFYQHQCVYCGTTSTVLEMDHVVPISSGGTHTKENIVPACRACNSRKWKKPLSLFMFDSLRYPGLVHP